MTKSMPDLTAANRQNDLLTQVECLGVVGVRQADIVFRVTSKHPKLGLIVKQSPAPDDTVSAGQPVTLYVNSRSLACADQLRVFESEEIEGLKRSLSEERSAGTLDAYDDAYVHALVDLARLRRITQGEMRRDYQKNTFLKKVWPSFVEIHRPQVEASELLNRLLNHGILDDVDTYSDRAVTIEDLRGLLAKHLTIPIADVRLASKKDFYLFEIPETLKSEESSTICKLIDFVFCPASEAFSFGYWASSTEKTAFAPFKMRWLTRGMFVIGAFACVAVAYLMWPGPPFSCPVAPSLAHQVDRLEIKDPGTRIPDNKRKEILEVYDRCQDIVLEIVGHTDSPGTETDNMKLSEQRALSLQSVLFHGMSFDSKRVRTFGRRDKCKLIQTNDSEPRNRRAEIWYVPMGSIKRECR